MNPEEASYYDRGRDGYSAREAAWAKQRAFDQLRNEMPQQVEEAKRRGAIERQRVLEELDKANRKAREQEIRETQDKRKPNQAASIPSNDSQGYSPAPRPKSFEKQNEERIAKALAIHDRVDDPRPGKDAYCGFCSSAYPCVTVQALTDPI
jgi:hypothetical protein